MAPSIFASGRVSRHRGSARGARTLWLESKPGTRYGTTFVAGSLHGPAPEVPFAATRNQHRWPVVKLVIVVLLFVGEATVCQPTSAAGSLVHSTM